MKELVEKLIKKYDGVIHELEIANKNHQEFINEANSGNKFEKSEVDKRMAFAIENNQRLDNAIAERNQLRTYL